MKKYYSLEKSNNEVDVNIYGDITSSPWLESDASMQTLSKELDSLEDVSQINVYINSYGGEVAEGLAIYNALRRHKAKVVTYCEGFACSIASVIFMAGDERIMSDSSLLMIHNAWTIADGNADQLRKAADDLEKISQASVVAYKTHSNLTEEEIKELMDNETWILPSEAVEYGFATKVQTVKRDKANQSARNSLYDIVKAYKSNNQVVVENGVEAQETAQNGEIEEEVVAPEEKEEVVEEEDDKTAKQMALFKAIINL